MSAGLVGHLLTHSSFLQEAPHTDYLWAEPHKVTVNECLEK